jgi:hypothetical protein
MTHQAERNQQQHAIDDEWIERLRSTKTCATCLELLPNEVFGTRAGGGPGARGLMSTCRTCDAARKRRERATRPRPQ